jgi:hypothetical protein
MKWNDCPECKEEGTVRVYDDEFAKRIAEVTGDFPVPLCRVCGYRETGKKDTPGKVGMSATIINIAQSNDDGTECVLVPLEMNGKTIGSCVLEKGGKAYATITDEEATTKIRARMEGGTISISKREE